MLERLYKLYVSIRVKVRALLDNTMVRLGAMFLGLCACAILLAVVVGFGIAKSLNEKNLITHNVGDSGVVSRVKSNTIENSFLSEQEIVDLAGVIRDVRSSSDWNNLQYKVVSKRGAFSDGYQLFSSIDKNYVTPSSVDVVYLSHIEHENEQEIRITLGFTATRKDYRAVESFEKSFTLYVSKEGIIQSVKEGFVK